MLLWNLVIISTLVITSMLWSFFLRSIRLLQDPFALSCTFEPKDWLQTHLISIIFFCNSHMWRLKHQVNDPSSWILIFNIQVGPTKFIPLSITVEVLNLVLQADSKRMCWVGLNPHSSIQILYRLLHICTICAWRIQSVFSSQASVLDHWGTSETSNLWGNCDPVYFLFCWFHSLIVAWNASSASYLLLLLMTELF